MHGYRPIVVMFVLLACALIAAPSAQRAAASPSLVGVWEVQSSTTAEGKAIRPAQPGLFIFTGKYYSLIQVTTATPRPDVKATPDTRVEDLMRVYGPAFQAQSGNYVSTDRVIVLHPLVAKSPVLMTPGFQQSYTFKVDGTTLYLSGPGTTAPTNYVLQRVE